MSNHASRRPLQVHLIRFGMLSGVFRASCRGPQAPLCHWWLSAPALPSLAGPPGRPQPELRVWDARGGALRRSAGMLERRLAAATAARR